MNGIMDTVVQLQSSREVFAWISWSVLLVKVSATGSWLVGREPSSQDQTQDEGAW